MNLTGKNFLVVGGAGFIGSQIVKNLLDFDVKSVTVFDNLSRGSLKFLADCENDKRLSLYSGSSELLSKSDLVKATKDIDGVFHLAALWLLECKTNPQAAIETNILGTLSLLEACVINNVRKFVFSSSASIYGDTTVSDIKENDPLNNRNVYGMTKISGEQLLRNFFDVYGLDYIALRYFNVYGKNQHSTAVYTGVIPKLINAIRNNLPITIDGDGSQSYDFIDVRDVARANVIAMQSDLSDRAFNVCTGIETSINDLCNIVMKIINKDVKLNYKPYSLEEKNQLVQKRVGSKDLSEKELGFIPKISLEEGLKDLIRN